MTKFRCALGALMLAAACGGDDGDGNGPETCGNGVCDMPGDEDCPSDCAPETCGDGTCDTDTESSVNCPQDCPPVVNCGNGACDGNEDCNLCSQDCGVCPETCGNGTCSGEENCTTCSSDCECGMGQVCRPDTNACAPISTNPLIESMPGRWTQVEPEPFCCTTVTVDPTQPNCGWSSDQVPGDACVSGFPDNGLVLSGTRLFIEVPELHIEGQVLNDGMRVEYDFIEPAGAHYVLEKEP